MTNEERKIFQEIKKKVEKVIKNTFEKYGIEQAYFEFKLTCSILDENFHKSEEYTLIDETAKYYCNFCNRETYYYDTALKLYLCPCCYHKIYFGNKKGGKDEKEK